MQTTKPCIACGNDIATTASLCKNCGSYQNKWKNSIKFWANASAVVAVAITAIAFLISISPDVRKTLFWKDSVDVVYLNSDDTLVITNQGDSAVFVAYALVQMNKEPPWTRQDLYIYSVIQQNEFQIIDLKKDSKIEPLKASTRFVSNMTDDEFLQEINKGLDDSDCYKFSYHDPTSLERIKLFTGDGLNTLPAFAYIFYKNERASEYIRKPIQVEVIAERILSDSCMEKYKDEWK